MDPVREGGKFLLIFGVCIAAIGAWFALGGRVPFRLGHLQGDIAYHGRRGSFYFPIMTCVIVSVVLTLIVWAVNLFRR
jgi:Protein of unknown function (DUF2905)